MLRFVGIKVFDKVCLVSPFLVLPCKFAQQHILLLDGVQLGIVMGDDAGQADGNQPPSGAFSQAGVMRHLALLFTLPVSGLAVVILFFFSLLLLLKGREEEGSTTLQPCPWAKSVSSCRLIRVIRLPRLTAFSLPEAISNRTILVLTIALAYSRISGDGP